MPWEVEEEEEEEEEEERKGKNYLFVKEWVEERVIYMYTHTKKEKEKKEYICIREFESWVRVGLTRAVKVKGLRGERVPLDGRHVWK